MNDDLRVDEVRSKILCLLEDFGNIDNSNNLIDCLDKTGYFISPASIKYHGGYRGGLALHSLNGYSLFKQQVQRLEIDIPKSTVIRVPILHDLCKAGAYINSENGGFIWNPNHPAGHALLSLKRVAPYINLSPLEIKLIKFHMGYYGTKESNQYGEYMLKELVVANIDPLTKLFHWCDDMESQFIKDKVVI